MSRPEGAKTEGMARVAVLRGAGAGGRDSKGADNTAMAEVDTSGGREAAREATARGDIRRWPTWGAVGSGGSMLGIAIVLPELSSDEVRCQMEEGALLELAATGICREAGPEASAKGDLGVALGWAALSWACCVGCCTGKPPKEAPGMLSWRGKMSDDPEPYADSGELARSIGMGGRRRCLALLGPAPSSCGPVLPLGEASALEGWSSSRSLLLRRTTLAAAETSAAVADLRPEPWSPDRRRRTASGAWLSAGWLGEAVPAVSLATSSMDMSSAVLAGLRSSLSEPGLSGDKALPCPGGSGLPGADGAAGADQVSNGDSIRLEDGGC